ncbi:MAG TPA: phosphopentomutase, partial [Acholeplasmatales bacterium]|nr:phosphopentomutase [Acholeplasmatales bacterium]
MGLKSTKPLPAFTGNGFPKILIEQLEKETGHRFIGNIAASGTEIIKDWGEEHLRTGALILYTSADSVLQIAANDKVTPLEELYRVCAIARRITLNNPDWMVGRIIARPFIGDDRHNFARTAYRHDYAVKPFEKTVLDYLKAASHDVIAIGKINDIFDGEGITKTTKIKSNHQAMEIIIKTAQQHFDGLCFANLVDFDALYGHRRDAVGYATCLEEFDRQLGELTPLIGSEDLLMIVADHGNDPVHAGTDHTREHVPLLVYNPNRKGVDLGTRSCFADVGATIADNFQVKMPENGTSFLKEVELEEEKHEN